jgi:hypothetical protein
MTWSAEFSWPRDATYMEGALMASVEADRLVGLLAADRFAHFRPPTTLHD